jgi:hypothetical protein
MIWTIWSGISSKEYLRNYLDFKKGKCKERLILDTFLTIEKLFDLAKKYKKNIISLDDVNSYHNVEYFIFFNMPNFEDPIIKNLKKYNKKFILIIVEAREIHPQNFNRKLYKNFKFIFTYNDLYIDNKKIFYYHFGVDKTQRLKISNNKKFLCMISSNKIINYHNSLYLLRLKIIKWFEKNKKWNFDLYGQGWNLKLFFSKYKFLRIINRINYFFAFIKNNFSNYKGEIKPLLKDKLSILKNYKFSFVIENFNTTNGWITEKIFHCFFCNVIPIYSGPPNVCKYIPENCYVDFNKFSSLRELCFFLKNMTKKKRIMYIRNKDNFLNSKKFDKFDINKNFSIVEKKLIFNNYR